MQQLVKLVLFLFETHQTFLHVLLKCKMIINQSSIDFPYRLERRIQLFIPTSFTLKMKLLIEYNLIDFATIHSFYLNILIRKYLLTETPKSIGTRITLSNITIIISIIIISEYPLIFSFLHLHLLFDKNTEIVPIVLQMLLIDLEVLVILVLWTL